MAEFSVGELRGHFKSLSLNKPRPNLYIDWLMQMGPQAPRNLTPKCPWEHWFNIGWFRVHGTLRQRLPTSRTSPTTSGLRTTGWLPYC